MLRVLGEEKYDEVMAVLGSFPHITMDIKLQGGSSDTLVRWLNVLQHAQPGLSLLQFLMMKTAIISQLGLLSL